MKAIRAILSCLFCALAVVSCEYVEEEREIGYKGLARVDHFLAAGEMAEELGMVATSYASIPEFPPPQGTTLVIPAASLQGAGTLVELQNWLFDGGNAIVFLTLKENSWELESEDPEFADFLDYFDFDYELQTRPAVFHSHEENSDLPKNKRVEQVDFPYARWMEDEYEADFVPPMLVRYRGDGEDDYEAVPIFSYQYGDGILTVVATARPFTNREIGKAQHASILWDLLSAAGDEEVWFVYSTKLSFFGMLWDHASHAIITLFVFLIFLVWWAAKGFGPRFHLEDRTTAKLDEHLQASGSFFLRHQADRLILDQLKSTLVRTLSRRVNLPINADPSSILRMAGDKGVIDEAEAAALAGDPGDKQLLTHLQILQNLAKKL